MIYLVPLALFLLLFAFPPTIKGRFATHNAARITRPVGPLNPDGSTTAFAHIQERGEYRLHKLLAIAAGVPFVFVPPSVWQGFAVPSWMVAGIVQLIAMLAVDQFTRTFEAIDFAGHGAEILAAEAAGDATYREAEIARTAKDLDKRGDDVPAQLARWHWLARIVFTLGRF